MITVQGDHFANPDGTHFTPIGFNFDRNNMRRVGLDAYMKRAAAAGCNVLREIWNPPIDAYTPWSLNHTFIRELKDIGRAARDNDIWLYPALIFPNPLNWDRPFLIWPKNPFSAKYATVDLFFRHGQMDFLMYQEACFRALETCRVFAVEVVNELSVDSPEKYYFINGSLSEARRLNQLIGLNQLITFSRPTPFWEDTELEKKASDLCNFIAFHSYGGDAMQWHFMPNRDWGRILLRESRVASICETVKAKSQGKPFMDTEIPNLEEMNPIKDFFNWLFRTGKPTSTDFDAHFGRVGDLYLAHGAASPGLPWAFTGEDITDGQLAQLKRIATSL